MKVSAILGSPRKAGVTSSLATAFMDQMKENGADTETFFLNNMKFTGCQGCQECKHKAQTCVLKDDLTPALSSLQQSDVLVFATPVYYWDVTGQFKLFFDRTWSLVNPDYKTNPVPVRIEKGKKALLITSQGDIEEKHRDVSQKYAGFLTMYGYDTKTLRAFGMGEQGENDLQPFLGKVKEIAAQFMNA
jgi:multimeric flavodoxin WrbA